MKPQLNLEQLNNLIDQSLVALKKDRDREIIRRRFGINDTGSGQTLEQIGQDLDITRERVRQIEKAALIRVAKEANHEHDFSKQLQQLLSQAGGIIQFETVLSNLKLGDDGSTQVALLTRFNPNFGFIDRGDHGNVVIVDVARYSERDIIRLRKGLINAITEIDKPAKFDKIAARIDGPHQPEALAELASAMHAIARLDGHWGLSRWPEVNPKSIRDKIYLVLKKSGRPMHFSEIARAIRELKANPKSVTTQAVHNELIKDSRFVLIGRGIYALAEWGYKAGTVADIIEEVLKSESPLSKDEIIARVLARRQVKPSTVVLNLQEKPRFQRVKKGIYQLSA